MLDTETEREKQYKILKELMNVVFRSLRRWRVIDFRIPAYLYRFKAFRARNHFPLLTSVSLYDLPPLPVTLPTMFGDAPHLNEIHFSNCRLEHYMFPLHQLTRVSLRGSTIDDCLLVLSNSPRLACCTITDIIEPTNPTKNTWIPVVALHLESLVITSVSALPELLDHLKIPVMRELTIDSRSSTFPFPNVNSFISRSSRLAFLQRLSLAGSGLHGSQLLACLGSTPSVVELCLSSWSPPDDIIQLISPCACSSGYLLPKLQILEYEGRPAVNFPEIKRIMLSRWRHGIGGEVARLRHVRLRVISGHSKTPPAVWPQHPQRIAEGMYLSIENVPPPVEIGG